LILCGFLSWTSACTGAARDANERPAARTQSLSDLRAVVDAKQPPASIDAAWDEPRVWKSVQRFYRLRDYQPAWFDANRPRRDIELLIRTVQGSAKDGLPPTAYDFGPVEQLRVKTSLNPFKRQRLDAARAAEIEARLTYVMMKYADHLVYGQVDPERVDRHWFGNPWRVDVASALAAALDDGRIDKGLESLAPQHPAYLRLRDAMARYQEIARTGGWPAVPSTLTAKPGGRNPGVAALRARLAATGDLDPSRVNPGDGPDSASIYDDAVVAAVVRFKSRHGLKPDGAIDKETLAALNVPVEARLEQMALNLERWRWLPERLGARHILVNIPTFRLEGYDGDRRTISMNVIVGTVENPTPIFSDQMTHIVFSPHWNVPESIATKETLPAVVKDPGYLARNNMEIVDGSDVIDPAGIDWSTAEEDFPYRFRQRPGTSNSLGLVKFMFPNQFNVYLHDTPADALFERIERDFSHGCVRVEDPVSLARWVLADQPEWTAERIQQAMHAGQERAVSLREPLPVYLLYQTSWVDSDGITQFRADLYDHDKRQASLLREHTSALLQTLAKPAS
jgi:murein L,D-transpeptidase YcbB/YkuD